MNDNRSRYNQYLTHIIEAISRIERFTIDVEKDQFLQNEMMQYAVICNLEIIGEASNNFSKSYGVVGDSDLDSTLSKAYKTRNMLIHGYYQVDLDLIWSVVNDHLPGFKEKIFEEFPNLKVKNTKNTFDKP